MPSFRVAHLREQGQDMVIVPMDSSFGQRTSSDQQGFVSEMQSRSVAAGLRGRVAVVWPGGFIAPNPWHPFFRDLSIQLVHANCNKIVTW